MLELSQLHELISKLSSLEDNDAIQAGIEDIFYQLLYDGQVFFASLVPSFIPGDTHHLYLRLFSHKEVAERYEGRSGQPCIELTAIESAQLATTAFRAGVYGFILNEGDKWITISLSEYLSIFLVKILQEPSLFNQQCADLVTFIGELRYPTGVVYTAVGEEGRLCAVDGSILVKAQEEGTGPDPSAIQATLSNILASDAEEIRAVTPRNAFAAPMPLLRAAFAFCGVAADTEYYSEQNPPNLSNWKFSDIKGFTIAFEPEELPQENPTQIADDNPAGEGQGILQRLPQATEVKAKLAAKLGGIKNTVKAKLEQVKKKDAPQDGREEAPEPEDRTEAESETEPPAPDDTPQTPETKKPFWTKHRKQMTVVTAGVLLLLLVVGGVFMVKHIQYQQHFEQFCTYVSQRDYGNAYVLYRDNHFGSDADAYLGEEIDQLILKYADNSITAEELSAALRALNNFPSMEQNLLTAQVAASKLEASKNAYVEGKESTDTYTRLNLWRQVIDLDNVNYAAVQQNVADNADAYVADLDERITYYSTRVRAFASERYEVLAYWYPDRAETQHWAGEYQSDRTTPMSFYPISISNISIFQTTTGYWRMYIDWKNTSVKSIKEVVFSVIALDSNGNPVVSSDNQGSWTIFDARDIGPYGPGEGTPSSEYVWNYVFYSPLVAQVQLTAVNVTYADGTMDSFTEDVDLAKMYRDF